MPDGPPQGPPSRIQAGVDSWKSIRAAQAQVQRDAAKRSNTRRRAGEFPGRRPGRKPADLRTMARNRLSRSQ